MSQKGLPRKYTWLKKLVNFLHAVKNAKSGGHLFTLWFVRKKGDTGVPLYELKFNVLSF